MRFVRQVHVPPSEAGGEHFLDDAVLYIFSTLVPGEEENTASVHFEVVKQNRPG